MVKITDINGSTVYLAHSAIASVTEAGAASQWHGIRSFVRTFDGKTLEARETADTIAAAMQQGDKP